MPLWKPDDGLFALIGQELFTFAAGDVMDKTHFFHQYLSPGIRPLHPDMILLGRALPVLSGNVFLESVMGSANNLMETPFGLMRDALNDLKPMKSTSILAVHRATHYGVR